MRKFLPLLATLLVLAGLWLVFQPAPPSPAPAPAPSAGTPATGAAPESAPSTATPVAASASEAPSAPALRKPLPAPSESLLLSPAGLNSRDLDRLLRSAGFDAYVDRLSREGDADALELTRRYRARMQSSLEADPRFSLSRLACGAYLCAASFRGPAGLGEGFGDLVMADEEPKVYAMLSRMLPDAADPRYADYRLVITIDPDHAAIEVQ